MGYVCHLCAIFIFLCRIPVPFLWPGAWLRSICHCISRRPRSGQSMSRRTSRNAQAHAYVGVPGCLHLSYSHPHIHQGTYLGGESISMLVCAWFPELVSGLPQPLAVAPCTSPQYGGTQYRVLDVWVRVHGNADHHPIVIVYGDGLPVCGESFAVSCHHSPPWPYLWPFVCSLCTIPGLENHR